MEAFRHFGLRAAPFDDRPDPAFFYAAGGHDEALASVRYAVHAGKSCAAVIGESGFGKTLIARMLAERVNRKTNVLWLNGVAQSKHQTELSVFETGALVGLGRLGGRPVEALLSAWTRSTQAWVNPTLLIVDSAESLRDAAWRDLLSLMTREFESGRRVTVVLFGLPPLRALLGTSRLERVRRRLFRLIELRPFSEAETAGYVAHRLQIAGRETPLFTDAALAAIHTTTAGNPALINQLCDNALVDAFAEERSAIDEPEVRDAVQAIIGAKSRTARLTPPPSRAVSRPRIPAAVQRAARKAESTLAAVDHSALRPLIERTIAAPLGPDGTAELEQLAASLPPLSDLVTAGQSARAMVESVPSEPQYAAAVVEAPLIALEAPPPAVDTETPAVEEAVAPPLAPAPPPRRELLLQTSLLDSRLQGVTTRITAALARIRTTHSPSANSTPTPASAEG